MIQVRKIKPIYASKVKSNVIGWEIKKKTHNLTQNCAENDPINGHIKAFYSAFQKIKI